MTDKQLNSNWTSVSEMDLIHENLFGPGYSVDFLLSFHINPVSFKIKSDPKLNNGQTDDNCIGLMMTRTQAEELRNRLNDYLANSK